MQGTVCKGVGSFYTILTQDGLEYVCKARGRFRKDGVSPVPGDRVSFEMEETGKEGRITEIFPRKNLLIRPAVSNLDKLLIVIAATAPKPDLLLVDKLLLQSAILGVEAVILVNKAEEDEETIALLREEYSAYRFLPVSAHTGMGLEDLKEVLKDSICCFAGQSAVGNPPC